MARSPLLMCKAAFLAPLPADLVSIVSAATPANGALSIAAQPVHARKLQIQAHVGTTTTTAITAGVVNISGMDQDNNAVSEAISVIANASTTFKSAYAYSQITSFTLSGYVASGSGTGNTIGVGVSNDFGIPGGFNAADFTLIKVTKVVTTWVASGTAASIAWSRVASDDVASTAVVDQAARTVAPTTAPAALGINDYEFTTAFDTPWLYGAVKHSPSSQ